MFGYRYSENRFVILLLGLLLAAGSASAQKKVKLRQADMAKGGRLPDGERYDRLLGNVIFTQNNTTIFCDSAHFFKKQNSLDAFGKVKIHEGDSVKITGSKLEYDGDKKVAKMRTNVVFTKLETATLYTDFLDYSTVTAAGTRFGTTIGAAGCWTAAGSRSFLR